MSRFRQSFGSPTPDRGQEPNVFLPRVPAKLSMSVVRDIYGRVVQTKVPKWSAPLTECGRCQASEWMWLPPVVNDGRPSSQQCRACNQLHFPTIVGHRHVDVTPRPPQLRGNVDPYNWPQAPTAETEFAPP